MERRRGILLVLTVVLISWFGSFLNKVSFDPNYSAIDVFSSALRKQRNRSRPNRLRNHGIIHGLMFSCQKKRAIKKKRLL